MAKHNRNPMIEVWRLAFSFLILMCHTTILPWWTPEKSLFRSASIGVEFFFILSGFLMASSVDRKTMVASTTALGLETTDFIWRKIKSIYPTYLFALGLELFVATFLAVPDKRTLSELVYGIWDMLFLRLTGLQGYSPEMIVGASWYLSGMILSMWILYPILRKNPDVFLNIVAPLVAVFVLGWFSSRYGNIKFQLDFENGICLGLLRSIAELCVGCVCFSVYKRLKLIQEPRCMIRVLATAGELVTMISVFFISYKYYRSQTDFLCIFLLAIGITLCFSGLSYSALLTRWVRLNWVGEFSLAIYLTHVVWYRMMSRWKIPIAFEWQVVIVLLLSVAGAVFCMYSIKLLSVFRNHFQK